MHNRIDRLKNIYLDNNFFNLRLAHLDQQSLAQYFASAGLQWCFSEELLLELFYSIQEPNTEKRQMMTRWASFCLALWPNSKVFQNYARILLGELDKKNMNMFYEKEEVGPIKEILDELSEGKTPSNISFAWEKNNEVKNSDEQFCLRLQALRQKGARELPLEQFSILFLMKRLAVDSPQDVEGRVREIVSNLLMYPHMRTYLSAAHKLSYVRTGKRHMFDQKHLVYATDMDYFVTDDGPMAILANQIFQGRPSVLTQEEFFELIGVVMHGA